jgi:hypothetical protein
MRWIKLRPDLNDGHERVAVPDGRWELKCTVSPGEPEKSLVTVYQGFGRAAPKRYIVKEYRHRKELRRVYLFVGADPFVVGVKTEAYGEQLFSARFIQSERAFLKLPDEFLFKPVDVERGKPREPWSTLARLGRHFNTEPAALLERYGERLMGANGAFIYAQNPSSFPDILQHKPVPWRTSEEVSDLPPDHVWLGQQNLSAVVWMLTFKA